MMLMFGAWLQLRRRLMWKAIYLMFKMASLLEWTPALSDQDVRQLGKLRPGRCHRISLKLKITPHLPCRYGTDVMEHSVLPADFSRRRAFVSVVVAMPHFA